MAEPFTALTFVLLGGLLGMTGQGARVVVGLKKQKDKAAKEGKDFKEVFDSGRLALSLVIGLVAGSLGAVILFGTDTDVTKDLMLMLVAVGYAGTDFIEGFIESHLPSADATDTADAEETLDDLDGVPDDADLPVDPDVDVNVD